MPHYTFDELKKMNIDDFNDYMLKMTPEEKEYALSTVPESVLINYANYLIDQMIAESDNLSIDITPPLI